MMSTTATPEPIPYWRGLIRQYASFLPVEEDTPIVSLHEGNTPLIHCERLVEAIGGEFDLYLKFEGLNPTASFKDRGMTMAMTKAVEKGAQVVICASTGNTSASAAAYAARAKLKCVVILPDGNIAMGKLDDEMAALSENPAPRAPLPHGVGLTSHAIVARRTNVIKYM